MKTLFKNPFLCLILFGSFLSLTACEQKAGDKAKESVSIASTPLAMVQTSDGQWVIMDSQKTILYEVFPYDNGPDYASDGLIRVVKNGKIGYANAQTYAIVITPQYDCAFPFENGKAKVSNNCKTIKDGEHNIWTSEAWQYVDKNGKF